MIDFTQMHGTEMISSSFDEYNEEIIEINRKGRFCNKILRIAVSEYWGGMVFYFGKSHSRPTSG